MKTHGKACFQTGLSSRELDRGAAPRVMEAMNFHACHREERSDVAIHLKFLDCRGRRSLPRNDRFENTPLCGKARSWRRIEYLESLVSTSPLGRTWF